MSIFGLKCSKSRGKSVVFDLGKSLKSKRIIGVQGRYEHVHRFNGFLRLPLARAGKYPKIILTAASQPHRLGNLSCARNSQGSKERGGGLSASKEL